MFPQSLALLILSLATVPALADSLHARFESASTVSLSNPHDLRLSPDGNHLLVADVGNNRVAILDPETLELVGSFGADHQSGTHDLDFDAAGRLYVADTHNNRVTHYEWHTTSAKLTGELSENIRGPEGVLAHSNGHIYVAGAWSGNLVMYKGERVVNELRGLSSPHDLVEAKDGNIWLADAGNHRILLLTPGLEIVRELSQELYDFNGVRYLDLLPDGTLVAADKYNHAIKFIHPNGKLIYQIGNGTAGRGPGTFTTPEGVEVRGSTLWLSDSGNDRVVKYSLGSKP